MKIYLYNFFLDKNNKPLKIKKNLIRGYARQRTYPRSATRGFPLKTSSILLLSFPVHLKTTLPFLKILKEGIASISISLAAWPTCPMSSL